MFRNSYGNCILSSTYCVKNRQIVPMRMVPNMIAVEHTACDDVSHYEGLFEEWDLSVTQLSSGKFGFTERRIRLPGADISWVSVGQANEAVEVYLKPGLSISFVLECDRFYRYNGAELSANSAFVQHHGEECAFSIGGQASVLELQVSDHLIADLDWTPPSDRAYAVSAAQKKELLHWAAAGDRCHAGSETMVAFQAGLLDRIGRMLRLKPDTGDNAKLGSGYSASGYEIVRRADTWFSRLPVKRPVQAIELAQALELSKRSLYRAFETWVGVGPSQYFEFKRLHAVRRALQSAGGEARQISEVAETYGFSNSGRMSKKYCELFREYPGHTLKRANQRHQRTL